MPPQPPGAVPPVLEDWVLAETFGDRQDLINGALRQFIDSIAEDMAPLRAAVRAREAAPAEALAHRLKGAALIVGAAQIAAASVAIEHAARAADWRTVDAQMSNLAEAAAVIKRQVASKS